MKYFIAAFSLAATTVACAQTKAPSISVAEVRRIETVLSHDSMQGRRAGTEGSAKTATFIAAEFAKAGLQPLSGNSFMQSFNMLRPKQQSITAQLNGAEVEAKNVIIVSAKESFTVNNTSGFETVAIAAGDNFFEKAQAAAQASKPTIVWIDTSFSRMFPRLAYFTRQLFSNATDVVFVLTNGQPQTFEISATQSFEQTPMANVVGILPGKSKGDEQVIFSAHYDHLGIGKPTNGDSIYNGANDDAAGTTAVIMLANYFKKLGGNNRTLIFAAFTAEEVGGFGATYFSQQLAPEKVAAMFNIEMIGTESKWGTKSAYITGFEKTDMGNILQKNLQGTGFTFHPDPYPEQNLFYRSDNATLARLGVPAHTISTSKMDSEKFYHTVDDELETLDMENMAAIINAIAQSSRSIVSGADAPSRVKKEDLK